mmetsp:Transcript_16581/g.48084  ORF Transcript_16581/g.48084 Transcript_16581/m.48084 type:complete len:206 (+) Transcript_16581:699-1316(+)
MGSLCRGRGRRQRPTGRRSVSIGGATGGRRRRAGRSRGAQWGACRSIQRLHRHRRGWHGLRVQRGGIADGFREVGCRREPPRTPRVARRCGGAIPDCERRHERGHLRGTDRHLGGLGRAGVAQHPIRARLLRGFRRGDVGAPRRRRHGRRARGAAQPGAVHAFRRCVRARRQAPRRFGPCSATLVRPSGGCAALRDARAVGVGPP